MKILSLKCGSRACALAQCGVLLFSAMARAEVTVPTLIGDHMVLQQETGAPIWGWANPGEQVLVRGSWGAEGRSITDESGRWNVFLQTPSFGGPYSLSIRGENEIEIRNVMIGEVWLCAGQSNMGWRLSAVFDGPEDAAQANYPGIRIFRSTRRHSSRPLEETEADWKVCTRESAATCSAVSFYFARKLHETLKVPIGIIVQPYAGTPIEGWMPKSVQWDDRETRALIRQMDEESAAYDLSKAQAQLARALARWERGERQAKPVLRRPVNEWHQYPGNIYNGMIHPIRPFGIRGMIWYQGERNAKTVNQAARYGDQLSRLIRYYRSSWAEESAGNVAADFPFYFVQLPSWLAVQEKPVEPLAAWAISREMMRRVDRSVPNTGMAVSIDTGDEVLLHPQDKKPIGLRLAYLALERTYGRGLVGSGPIYRSSQIDGGRIILTFDSVGSGLMSGRGGELSGFAIAGADRRFVWATAQIDGDSVRVRAKDIKDPVAVRYAWAMNPSQNNLLYNREGLPASPFRTDHWPLELPEGIQEEQQVKPVKPTGYVQKPLRRPPMRQ